MGMLIHRSLQVDIDWTSFFEYQKLVEEEIAEYSETEVTDDLLLGGIHANPAWEYWFQFLERQWQTHFSQEVVAFANQKQSPRILSLGCGHGGFELAIASKLQSPYELIALDLNPYIWNAAIERAKQEHFHIEFHAIDLNFVEIKEGAFDVIYAHASLHHMLNLEHLFEQIYHGLKPDGRFIVLDMIGEVQTLFWQENVAFAIDLVNNFPPAFRTRFTENPIPSYHPPALQVGMEGIRQEELETEIQRYFQPLKLFKYNSLMRLIGTNPVLGNLFDLENAADRSFLDTLCHLDIEQVATGKLRPTEMFGVYAKKPDPESALAAQARAKFLQSLLINQQLRHKTPETPDRDNAMTLQTLQALQHELQTVRQQLSLINGYLQNQQNAGDRLQEQKEELQAHIAWMKTSKFWKLRQLWQALKSLISGGKNADGETRTLTS